MLTSRVIPVLLYSGAELVKGQKFDSWRGVGSALQQMQLYERRKVDELIFLDVAATRQGREPDYNLISEVANEFSVPLTVGGGIRTIDHVKKLLRSGADKVSIGTCVDLIPEIAHTFGKQAVVGSVDYRDDECYVRSGLIPTCYTPERWAAHLCNLGAGEILLNSIERDGTMVGYDTELIRRVSGSINVPVIACGGCSGYEDMAAAIAAGAAAVAAGALFTFTQATPIKASRFLRGKGFHVRV